MSNSLVFIRRQLYALKREYGRAIDLYSVASTASDLTIGKRQETRTKYAIRRAIVLPVSFNTMALYTRVYLQNVGKDFAYGAYIDQEMKKVIIDAADLPRALEILPEFEVMIDHHRYSISRLEKLENNYGYLLTVKRATGNQPKEIHTRVLNQSIRFNPKIIRS